jgi:hypothetical protein
LSDFGRKYCNEGFDMKNWLFLASVGGFALAAQAFVFSPAAAEQVVASPQTKSAARPAPPIETNRPVTFSCTANDKEVEDFDFVTE